MVSACPAWLARVLCCLTITMRAFVCAQDRDSIAKRTRGARVARGQLEKEEEEARLADIKHACGDLGLLPAELLAVDEWRARPPSTRA